MSDNYRGAEEILSDESFLSWYFKTGDGKDRDWLDWMSSHPECDEQVRQAIVILETTRLPERHVPEAQLRAAEARLFGEIDRIPRVIPVRRTVYRWLAAAVVLGILAAGWLLFGRPGASKPEVSAAFGQILNRQLPDGTEVTMNANSRLRYSPDWKNGEDREVWVNGEAFFHVRKTPEKSRFIVHTDHFDVIVTGTRFNVVNRHGRDNVLLEEGSVTILTKDGRTLHMLPGDFMAYDSSEVRKAPTRPDSVLAWKDQKLVLDHTPMSELATIIQDHYGVDLQLADDSVGDRLISAILPNNNLEVLLQALEATGDFDIKRTGDSISIRLHRRQDQN